MALEGRIAIREIGLVQPNGETESIRFNEADTLGAEHLSEYLHEYATTIIDCLNIGIEERHNLVSYLSVLKIVLS